MRPYKGLKPFSLNILLEMKHLSFIQRIVIVAGMFIAGQVCEAYNVTDSIKAEYTRQDCQPIEGLWQLLPGGAVIAIRATTPQTYELVAVDAPAPSVLPGTVIGEMVRTASDNSYDGKIHLRGFKKMKFTAQVDDRRGTLELYQYHRRLALNFWHLAPWLFRYSVSVKNTKPSGTEGAVRLWPRPGHLNPVQL